MDRSTSPIVLIFAIATIELGFHYAYDGEVLALSTDESAWALVKQRIVTTDARVDVVFVGDSTVRAGIDARVFEAVSGLSAINLGMTGDYITYGDYAALRLYLEDHNPPPVYRRLAYP